MPLTIFDEPVQHIVSLLEEGGAGEVLAVGGSVRDYLLGDSQTAQDIDLEVYGLSYSQIAEILRPHFRVDMVGQSFGVIKVSYILKGIRREVDVALPRRESKCGIGHKGFGIETPSNLSFEEAFARRDFTINAIGMRRDGSIVDPYNGRADLEKKILRGTSPSFKDDPLRVLRGVQFAARFGFEMEPGTIAYCREILSEFPTLSPERIYEEWKKWALLGEYPSLGLGVLRKTGWVEAFPELNALIGTPQNPQWHPEGDVWTHTLLVCNEAKKWINESEADGNPFSDEEKIVLMFAALAHDFGKPAVTRRDESGIIRSHGHAEKGEEPTRHFLESMKAPNRITERVIPLVKEHMVIIHHLLGAPTPKAVRRLSYRLKPATIRLWIALCQSDALGCFSPATELKTIRFRAEDWTSAAEEAHVIDETPKPVLMGRHLIPLGVQPGKKLGSILDIAYRAQLDGEFADAAGGIEWLIQRTFLPPRQTAEQTKDSPLRKG